MKHADVFKKIATLLPVLPAEAFNMGHWEGRAGSVNTPCGTSRCAIGWAVHLGIAPEGLTIEPGAFAAHPVYRSPRGGKIHRGFKAVAVAFGIPVRDAEHLFGGGSAHTAKQVANRMRAYVRNHA